ATLGALAALARVPFASIPNVQPTTFLVMLSGYVFGMRVGFLVGGIAALFSNVFLGQGPWTLWQMLAWGLSGASAGLLRRLLERQKNGQLLATTGKKWLFSVVCMLWGFLFGWIMNLWMFISLGAL
ncbi:ECF transporter S component, partial [Frankia sp. Cpl3]|nr:ECF transporter S component [Frankia sp. Cpl3]